MKLGEIRQQNLLLILQDLFDGKTTLLATRLGKKPAQISQWKSGHRAVHEDSARLIESAAGKPPGWMDVRHESGHEGLVVREAAAPVPFHVPRPSLRVALEALCEELARVTEPERRESVGALLRACAMAGGDASYIEPLLALLRVKSAGSENSRHAA
jgi:hypothetical protein